MVLARKKSDGGLFAIKAVRKEKLLHAGVGAVQHMLDENKILQTMKHSFILTLEFAFQDEARLYLVTNYVGGGTLYQLIMVRTVLPEDVGRFYTAQLVSAFEYLHENGVVYRDLKPENVLLGVDGYLVLADFGLAKSLGLEQRDARTSFRTSIGKAETFCGTPLYLAPEVVARAGKG